MLVDRLLSVDRPVAVSDGSLVVAVVPVGRHPELLEEPLRELLEAFAHYGRTACGRRQDLPQGNSVAQWARHLEISNRHVVYVADHEDAEWFSACVRQADRVLLLADAVLSPGSAERALGREISELAPYTPVQVVLLHRSSEPLPRGTAAWASVLRPPLATPPVTTCGVGGPRISAGWRAC